MEEHENHIKVQETECLGFTAYEISNGCIEVIIVPEIGGRIMGFGYIGNNILFQNISLYKKKPSVFGEDPAEIKKQREQIGYLLYGGEKTWLAPQDDWENAPYVDLDSGEYKIKFDMETEADTAIIELESPLCRETKLKIKRSVRIPSKGNRIYITQKLENHSSEIVTKGLWQVTMINRPAVVSFPCDGYSKFENGVKCFFINGNRADIASIKNTEAYISCEDNTIFKFGSDINKGYVNTSIVGTDLIFKKEFEINDGPYGHECAVEVFNSADYEYLEVEVHSPLKQLDPGDSMEYTVCWSMNRG